MSRSRANPFRYFVDATRAVFHGDYASAAVAQGAVVAVVLTVGAVTYGSRRFRDEHT